MHCAWQSSSFDISSRVGIGIGSDDLGVDCGDLVVGCDDLVVGCDDWGAAQARAAPNKRRMDLEMATMFRSVTEEGGSGS